MIHVRGRLTHGSSYIAGEEVVCQLTFTNTTRDQAGIRLSSDIVTLAWATAQIYCQCTLNDDVDYKDTKFVDKSLESDTTPAQTSFHPTRRSTGHTILRTAPQILFCNIKISPGESVQYTYKEQIPYHSLPSFKGTFVKYSYHLAVGTQKPDSAVSEIKIPIRVLYVEGLKEAMAYQDKELVLAPSNPFQVPRKDNSQPELTTRDLALQLVADQSARKRQKCFNISNKKGKVASIYLAKSAYKLGEDVLCTFDLSDATVQCMQIAVTLQSIEELSENHRKAGARFSNTLNHAVHRELCLHMSKVHMSIPIPLHVTQSFSSDIATLSWKLHLEFLTLDKRIADQEHPTSTHCAVLWQGVSDLDTETMQWDLPITLLATNPLQCTLLYSSKYEDSTMLGI